MKLNRLLVVLLFLVSTTVLALPTAKITLKVVDEQGVPVEGARAGVMISVTKSGKPPQSTGESGLTDSEGLFTGSGVSPQYIRYGASKEGYYGTGYELRLQKITGITGFRRWEPWNPTVEVVLKKKINPIPLYAVNMDSLTRLLPKIPVLDRFIGYDLIARDWVVPHGLGTHRDFLFKLEKHHLTNDNNYRITLALNFSNEGDGIQSYYAHPREGSNLRLPHHAPIAGYETELIVNRERTTTKRISKKDREDQNYFFRVRTEKDEQGNIISALYGKIHGPIELAGFVTGFPTGSVKFNYYLNPTPNDTNLEFDPKKNLFKDLTQNEEVMNP